jgi:hypothetical protein
LPQQAPVPVSVDGTSPEGRGDAATGGGKQDQNIVNMIAKTLQKVHLIIFAMKRNVIRGENRHGTAARPSLGR